MSQTEGDSQPTNEDQSFSTRDIFKPLQGQTFTNFGELEEAIVPEFNKALADFPPEFTYLHALEYGAENNLVRKSGEFGFLVDTDDLPEGTEPTVVFQFKHHQDY